MESKGTWLSVTNGKEFGNDSPFYLLVIHSSFPASDIIFLGRIVLL